MWQYYLSAPIDGKHIGWHDYTPSASEKLDSIYNLCRASTPLRTIIHVRSGFFHYKVDLTKNTQKNTTSGTVRPIRRAEDDIAQPSTKKAKTENPDLNLEQLFAGGMGHVWEMLLTPVLESTYDAWKFIGPSRNSTIFPVRELTFQALKPKAPGDWRVVVFGQNPYPRLESATGIALFDNAFSDWESKHFGKASSMRCIIKAAAMAKYGISAQTAMPALRNMLQERKIVSPPKWFQAMLGQGVLLLNSSLTVGGAMSSAQHTSFWAPIIETIVDSILLAKSSFGDDDENRGVLFLWWGNKSLKVKKSLEKVFKKYSQTVPVKHVEWYNPAAQGDIFCKDPMHFKKVNDELQSIGQKDIEWLPDENWMEKHVADCGVYGEFITSTQKLHKMYMERLQNGLDTITDVKPLTGISQLPLTTLPEACDPLGLAKTAHASLDRAKSLPAVGSMSEDEKGAIYMYTGNSFYRRLNEALRCSDRNKVKSYISYLRLFIEAYGKIPVEMTTTKLYRGIHKDVSYLYKEGSTVTWWSVSSCSSSIQVAKSFGSGGTLFYVDSKTAVPIQKLSAYQHEREYLLAPGTQLVVVKVKKGKSFTEIFLEEKGCPRLVR